MFKGLFGNKRVQAPAANREEAVLIHLNGLHLDDATYATFDVENLEDLLIKRLRETGAGDVDGHETGPGETIVFVYGPDSQRLLTDIEPILKTYPLCKNSRVIVRHGAPGSVQHIVYPQGMPN